MRKAINVDNSGKNIVRVLSIADETVIENKPTGLEYILVEDFTEPPELNNHLSKNYPMYDKINKQFKWIQVQYQNTVTPELLELENLKSENGILKSELTQTETELVLANENINMLTEALADLIGGAL